MREIIITAPSLDPTKNVSGVSSVVSFIIDNNPDCKYFHFELGKRDDEHSGIARIGKLMKALWRWIKLLRRHPEALVHYSFPLSGPSILRDPLFILLARCMRRKIVVHIHGGVYLTSPAIPRLFRWILHRIFSMNVPFIALSDKECRILEKKFGAKNVYSLPNCVDLRDALTFVREENSASTRLRIGYLGRIAATKGMNELLTACAELRRNQIPIELHLAGAEENKGEFLPAFVAAVGEELHYWGVISGSTKNAFLRSLDVFVLPSYFEGLPISMLECMSYGAVPVVTPVGSIPEVVYDGENGVLIEVKDAHSIASAITRIYRDEALRITLRQNARKTVFEDFSTSKYIRQLNEIYDLLC